MSFSPPSDPWHARLPTTPFEIPCRHWLTGEGSLTARIRERCDRFSVQIVRQKFLRPCQDERAVLNMSSHEWAWVREVLLLADGVPVVFAHSILAQRHARGHWQMFARMGERPLGAALFADPRIARQPLRYRRLDARHPLYRMASHASGIAAAPATPATLWARRSVFSKAGQSLLVTEVFLPGILES